MIEFPPVLLNAGGFYYAFIPKILLPNKGYMILIDLKDSTSTLTTNIGDTGNDTVTMTIYYPYDGSSIDISLGTDTSQYKDRYNQFEVSNSEFISLNEGMYIYEVYAPELKETGSLRIINSADLSPLVQLPDTNTNEFIVYE